MKTSNKMDATNDIPTFASKINEITSEVSTQATRFVLNLFKQKLALSNLQYEPIIKPLIVLDLNGFLIYRDYIPRGAEPQIPVDARRVNNFVVWRRPGLEGFLKYIFHNFNVAVWSSVAKHNLDPLVDYTFGLYAKKLLFTWDQTSCEKTQHPLTDKKPLFLKNLSKIWDTYPYFDKSNTLIIDDSNLKMTNNPGDCCIIVKEWKPRSKRVTPESKTAILIINVENDKISDEYYDFDISKGLMLRLACYLTVPGRTMVL